LQAEFRQAFHLYPALLREGGATGPLQRIQRAVVQPLAEGEALVLGQAAGAVQRPAYDFPQQRDQRRAVGDGHFAIFFRRADARIKD